MEKFILISKEIISCQGEKKGLYYKHILEKFYFRFGSGRGTERRGEVMSKQEMVCFNVPNTVALNILGGGYNT